MSCVASFKYRMLFISQTNAILLCISSLCNNVMAAQKLYTDYTSPSTNNVYYRFSKKIHNSHHQIQA